VAEKGEIMKEDISRIEVATIDVVHHHVLLRKDAQDQGVGQGAETGGLEEIVSTAPSAKAIQV
jgi:hypothetical protein